MLCGAQVMKGPLRDLFDASQLLTDVSGSGNNWGHGFCVYGPKYEEAILDQLHRAVEACDSPQVGAPYDSGFLDQVQGEGNHQHHQRHRRNGLGRIAVVAVVAVAATSIAWGSVVPTWRKRMLVCSICFYFHVVPKLSRVVPLMSVCFAVAAAAELVPDALSRWGHRLGTWVLHPAAAAR
jgi:hypothetical protein